jgi:undecaprenyl diphosphate synthase
LYAFSTENWSRPKIEVDALMNLLVSTIRKEVPTLNKNNVRLLTIGDTDNLPKKCRKELLEAIKMTENNSGLNLVLALNYSGRWDILNAVKKIVDETAQGIIEPKTAINVEFLEKYLSTNHIPDPELVIRTSGESRISNFLLWQIAYSELYISPILWPDFRKEHLYEAIIDYQKRERRFGKTSEQVRM